jgi:hypothetical protein
MADRGHPVRRCADSGLVGSVGVAVFAIGVGCLRFGSVREA